MAYQKTEWVENETLVSADKLNKIEDQLQKVTLTSEINEVAIESIDAKVEELSTNVETIELHMDKDTTNAHLAKNISMADGTDLETFATNLKTSVSDIKTKVASAVTDKGIPTLATDTADIMAANIRKIKTGEYGNVTANDVRNTKTFGTENGVLNGTLDLSGLIPSNIKSGVIIDGVTGTLESDPITKFIAGDNIIYTDDSEVTGDGVIDYPHIAKKKVAKAKKSGVIRVSFQLKATYDGSEARAQIFRNDSAVGIKRTQTYTIYSLYTEDIAVSAGDEIQLYVWSYSTAHPAKAKEFRIGIGNDLPFFDKIS